MVYCFGVAEKYFFTMIWLFLCTFLQVSAYYLSLVIYDFYSTFKIGCTYLIVFVAHTKGYQLNEFCMLLCVNAQSRIPCSGRS